MVPADDNLDVVADRSPDAIDELAMELAHLSTSQRSQL